MTGLSDTARQDIERACERLIRRFAQFNDAGDHAQVAACFTEDGTFARPTDPDNPVRGRAAIEEFFRSRPRRLTRHVMVNSVVDAESETEARAHSYVVLYAAPLSDGPAPVEATQLIGDFHDRFQCVDGRWLFKERRGSVTLKVGANG